LERYRGYGVPMTFGEDLGPYNAGPLWIWTYLSGEYVTDGGKTTY